MLKNLTKQWYQRRVREVIMDGKIANRCVICLSGITNDLAVIPDCKHNYCYECIMGWASKQLFCPLCKVRFHSLHRYAVVGQDDYTVQYLSEPTRQVDNSVPDLACLSDKYFIGEIDRLIDNCHRASKSVFSSNQKHCDMVGLGYLKGIISSLDGLKTMLRGDSPFDPNSLLNELYEMESQIKLIWEGKVHLLVPSKTVEIKRYGVDDVFDEDDEVEENDDYYYDDYVDEY
eukprot:TRINITY_DN1870_c0_g2_i8.p1 TRINITY_DN1870_c0_g2~~TRINITY_DN1870_c0_g2_i8.p1  ORF type:complete len:231 (-),score=48.66 TRINITY_DN1870_c0_g2_i8:52-744(-)